MNVPPSFSVFSQALTSCAVSVLRATFGSVTTLEEWIAPQVAAHAGHSGFRVLPNGLDAFVARAALIDLAERTLDLQYYIFHPDQTVSRRPDRRCGVANRGLAVGLLLADGGAMGKEAPSV